MKYFFILGVFVALAPAFLIGAAAQQPDETPPAAEATQESLPPSTESSSMKPKIGIMKFEVSENVGPAIGTFLYNRLTGEMVKSKKYTVVDWEEIGRLLKYIEESQPNISQDEARRQAINQLGIQKMYLGSTIKLGDEYFITVKVLNLDLSVDKVEEASATNEKGLPDAIREIAANLYLTGKELEEREAQRKAQAQQERERRARAEEERRRSETEISGEWTVDLALQDNTDYARWSYLIDQDGKQVALRVLCDAPPSKRVYWLADDTFRGTYENSRLEYTYCTHAGKAIEHQVHYVGYLSKDGREIRGTVSYWFTNDPILAETGTHTVEQTLRR